MSDEALNVFFTELRQFQTQVAQLTDKQNQLLAKKDQLKAQIQNASQFNETGLNSQSQLSQSIEKLKTSIKQSFEQWDESVQKALPMQQLANLYQDRIMFLVFGKVNAGKSSFTNQVVHFYKTLFPEDSIRHFRFENGAVVDLGKDHFDEGFTETTAQIQGVELGKNFVLLDSPGLHSVTDENGDLTRQFIDSADAVLWLTPSTSPGQVQELHDLKAELEKGKPLLPVITRSDVVDETWDEKQKTFVTTLQNKSDENRKLQENDVRDRLNAFQSFALQKVETPISISVHCFKSDNDLNASGLGRLFDKMSLLIKQAGQYKVSKADKTVQNFFKDNVENGLEHNVKPQIIEAKQQAETAIERLKTNQTLISNKVVSYASGQVFNIVDKHKESRNKSAILTELNELLNQRLNSELAHSLSEFTTHVDVVSSQLDQSAVADFTDNVIEYEVIKGSRQASLVSSGGAATGAAAGAAVGSAIPVVGTAIGAAVGGILGGLFGRKKARRQTEWVTEVVGVSTAELEASLQQQLSNSIPQIVETSIQSAIEQIQPILTVCQQLENELNHFSTTSKN